MSSLFLCCDGLRAGGVDVGLSGLQPVVGDGDGAQLRQDILPKQQLEYPIGDHGDVDRGAADTGVIANATGASTPSNSGRSMLDSAATPSVTSAIASYPKR